MRKRVLVCLVLGCALALSLTACASHQSGATGEQEKASPTLTTQGMNLEQQIDNLKTRNETYTPEVVTNADGVKVQLVPDSPTSYLLGNEAGYDHNVFYINGNNRGCMSCHTTGLYDLANNGIMGHIKLRSPMKSDLGVLNCIQCHDKYGVHNADLFHGIHLDHFDGSCNSCHVADKGEFKLWEEGKYEVLNGITKIDASKLDGDFTYDQTTTSDPMSVDWTYDKFEIEMFDNGDANKPLDDDTYNNWEITFTGAVDKQSTVKLTDLIAQAEKDGAVKEFDMTLASADCYPDSGLIGNSKYKGIEFNYVMQVAGVTGDAVAVTPLLPNGSNVSNTIDLDLIDDCAGSYLIYEINGNRIGWEQGYPVAFVSSAWESSGSGKWVSELRFETTQSIMEKQAELHVISDRPEFSSFAIAPNSKDNFIGFVGFANLYDGQIVNEKEAYQLEGYAYSPSSKVTSVELSFDRGKTWKKLDVTNCEPGKWVYWKFNKSYEKGSYVVSARATFENGETIQVITDKTITVK